MSNIQPVLVTSGKVVNLGNVRVIRLGPENTRAELWEHYENPGKLLHVFAGDDALIFDEWLQTYAVTPGPGTVVPDNGFVRLSPALAINMAHVRVIRFVVSTRPTLRYIINFFEEAGQGDYPFLRVDDDAAQTLSNWFRDNAHDPTTGAGPLPVLPVGAVKAVNLFPPVGAAGDTLVLGTGLELEWQTPGTISLVDGSVTTQKLADEAVTAAKIAANTITADRVAPGVIPTVVPASESTAGIVVLGDDATVLSTLTDEVVTARTLGVRLPLGTALALPRYDAAGNKLEATTATLGAAGELALRTLNSNPVFTITAEHTGTTGAIQVNAYQPGTGAASLTLSHAWGTLASPARITNVATNTMTLSGRAWVRNATDTADDWVTTGTVRSGLDALDAQGRAAGNLVFLTAPGVSAAPVEVARLSAGGTLLIGGTTTGTGLTKGVVLYPGTAPTTTPAGLPTQLWTATRAGVATSEGLHIRTGSGTLYLFADRAGLGTLTPETTARHTIAGTATNDMPLAVVTPSNGTANFGPMITLTRRTSGDMADAFGLGLTFNIADNALTDNVIGHLLFRRQGNDNSGRFVVNTALNGTIAADTDPGDFAVGPSGNVTLGANTFAAGGARVLALGPGTAPTANVADTVQMWSADRAGVAGQAGLHMRTEGGTQHVFADRVGIGTLTPATALDVIGALTVSDTATTLTGLGLGTGSNVQYARLGLGTATSTDARLVFSNTLEQKILLYAATTTRYGLGVASASIQVFSPDNGRVDFGAMSATDGTTFTRHMTIIGSSGNVGIGSTTAFGTGAANILAIGIGTAPTTSPANMVQLWVTDTNAVAGKAGLHMRSEDGTQHVFGDLVGLGTVAPAPDTLVTIDSPTTSTYALKVYGRTTGLSNQTPVLNVLRHTTGDMPDLFGTGMGVWIADNAGVENLIGQVLFRRQGADNSGRFVVKTVNAGAVPGNSTPGNLAVDPVGNVSVNLDVLGNGGTRVFALGSGTAPTTSPADGVQMWSADLEGAAGTAGLLIRSEDGVVTRIGTGLLTRNVILGLPTQTIAAPYVMTADESNKVFIATNTSAMVQIDLPSAANGLTVTVMTYTGMGVRIRAAAGDGFRYGATIGPVAGYIETAAIHQSITLIAVNTAWWQAMSVVGTWTMST